MKTHLPIPLCAFAFAILMWNPFAYFIDGAAISSSASFSLVSNQRNPLPKNGSLVSGLGLTPYHCTGSPVWFSPDWNPADCAVALLRLALTEVDRHGDKDFEFRGPGASPQQGTPPTNTPRRYTSGEYEQVVEESSLIVFLD